MSQEYKNLPFEEPSFVQNMDSNLKLLLETFMMLDEYKMVIVLKQFYRIVKLLRENKDVLKSIDNPKDSLEDINKHSVTATSLKKENSTESVKVKKTIKMRATEEPKRPSIELGNVLKSELCNSRKIEKKKQHQS